MDVARTAVLLALVACFGLLVASVVADVGGDGGRDLLLVT